MNKLIILLFLGSLLFAVQPVVRNTNRTTRNDDKIKNEDVVKENKDDKVIIKKDDKDDDKNNDKKDRFQDADSNGVNDQREDDLQKIKNLNTKFKDLIKKTDKGTKSTPTKKPR